MLSSITIIADSGSTKTEWACIGEGAVCSLFSTTGINPTLLSDEAVRESLAAEVLPRLLSAGIAGSDVGAVCFYGAGCTAQRIPSMTAALTETLGVTGAKVEVASDMLGAAVGVCGGEAGVVAILGTGSNSCLFDGNRIVASTPALGYVLGDEGSGAALGKRVLCGVLKGTLPKAFCRDFLRDARLTEAEVVERVYRGAAPNRFLASMTPHIIAHIDVAEVRQMVVDSFREFFANNIRQYASPHLDVNVVGSVGHYFQLQLREAARAEGFRLGRIVRSPIEGLVSHFTNRK